MDNLRGLLCIRRMDRVPNAQIRKLCGVRRVWLKGLKVFSGSAMWRGWRDRIAKRVCVGKCAGSPSVGRPRKK